MTCAGSREERTSKAFSVELQGAGRRGSHRQTSILIQALYGVKCDVVAVASVVADVATVVPNAAAAVVTVAATGAAAVSAAAVNAERRRGGEEERRRGGEDERTGGVGKDASVAAFATSAFAVTSAA